MGKFVPVALVLSMAAAGAPLALQAAAQQLGTIKGVAHQTNLQPLANATVQIRSVRTATVVHSTTAGPAGDFSFSQIQPDTYVIEIVDATGRVIGTSAPTTVAGDAVVTASVTASAPGTAVVGKGAGFNMLGLGPTTSVAVLGAAGAVAVTAVVATRPDASPSR